MTLSILPTSIDPLSLVDAEHPRRLDGGGLERLVAVEAARSGEPQFVRQVAGATGGGLDSVGTKKSTRLWRPSIHTVNNSTRVLQVIYTQQVVHVERLKCFHTTPATKGATSVEIRFPLLGVGCMFSTPADQAKTPLAS